MSHADAVGADEGDIHPQCLQRAHRLLADDGPLAAIAAAKGCTPSQVALAWLLQRSPAMLPIPGTGSIAHLEGNCAAAEVRLGEAEMAALEARS